MAPPPPVFIPPQSVESSTDWYNEHGQEDFHFVNHSDMTNADVAAPPSSGFASKHVNQKSNQNSISVKSSLFNEKKSHIYVHHYNKVPSKPSSNYMQNWRGGSEIHQNTYKHEFSNYYDAKVQSFRKQFDNLSLNSRNMRAGSPHRILKGHGNTQRVPGKADSYSRPNKIPQVKSTPTAKIQKLLLLKPEHKAAIDKLEESYWAKWKPSKVTASKEIHPKAKGLYTENEKSKAAYQIIDKNERKERGDSIETIPLCSPSAKLAASIQKLVYVSNSEIKGIEQVAENEVEVSAAEESEDHCKLTSDNISEPIPSESISECNIGGLKHTDSFILNTKKQTQEKQHYQQPKCIKLFKNVGYSSSTPVNYLKGGTYPLKSCLKKERASSKSSNLGRPGSPIMGSGGRRIGKPNRFGS